jgi:hypothetical protein
MVSFTCFCLLGEKGGRKGDRENEANVFVVQRSMVMFCWVRDSMGGRYLAEM